MRKITQLFGLLGMMWAAQTNAQTIFFSEYAEGTQGNNKYIEIANPTDKAVDLSDYLLVGNINGGSTRRDSWDLDGSYMIVGVVLQPGQVYTIANNAAKNHILSKADTAFGFVTGKLGISFNGDDWFALLRKSDSSFVDEIGLPGADPGTGWNGAGVTNVTVDKTLVRKPGIKSGNTWNNSAGTDAASSEWLVSVGPNDTVVNSGIGSHKFETLRMVKFSVDMSSETVSANGVHVAGNFQGWSPSGTKLTQEGSTSIYSTIVELNPNSLVEYKFINNNDWSSGVEGVPAISQKGHKNNGETNDNRWFWSGTGKDTLVLPAFKFSGSAPSGQYAVRFAVDLKAEASVSADGVHLAGNLQGWDPGKSRMVNLYSSNKIHEIIFCLSDGTYAFKYVNGNAWGKDESVPGACAVNNNREVVVNGANIELNKVCYGSCDVCPGAPAPKYRVTFQVDMASECNVDDVDIAGGKINGWSGGTMLSNQSGLSGDWKITKIGVGPSKGDISWFSESINATTRACMQDDRVILNRDGSFHNVMGSETWIEGWQKTGANGCGTPVAPFDGSTAGTWKDHGNGSFTVYGKGSHVGLPKVVNGAEISKNEDARDSVTYEYSITGTKLTTYINFGGGYWQFEYDRNTSKSTVWSTTIVLDSGAEIAHKIRKITKSNGSDIVSWEGGSDRKIFAHGDTTLLARCFGKDEACSGTPIPAADVTFKVDMSQEIAADTVWLMGSMTIPAWQSGAIAMTPSATEKDVYETTVKGICPDYFEYKFANEAMNSQTTGEKFPDTTDRSCLVDNGLGAFNRKLTRTNGDAITVFYMFNSCMMGGNSNVADLSSEVSIAPVPAVESFTVRLAGSTATQVSIMSIDGRVVRSMNTNSSTVEMNCSGLNGVYLVSIVDQMGRTAVKKIVCGQ